MTRQTVPDRALVELGRTEAGPGTLAFLTRDQDTRRLLLLRAVLDAADAADPALCPPELKTRLKEDWALLAAADRPPGPAARTRAYACAGPGHGPAPHPPPPGSPYLSPPGAALSPARALLFHPLTGPLALSCLRGLDDRGGPPDERGRRGLRQDLAHFSAMAAAAAARAGIPFTVRLTARAGLLALPSLGALHTAASGDAPVDVTHAQGRLTLSQADAPDVVVQLESGVGAWAGAPAWTPLHALPGLPPAGAPMPLEDLDPYRAPPGPRHPSFGGPATLDDAERKRWLQAWSGTATALRTGGERRVAQAVALLRCLVPLERPPGAGPDGRDSCSATRHEAFGALLASTPQDAPALAETLVHELHHAQLASLTSLVTLHHATAEPRYFAPWKTDPRPYDALLQGAYAHLAVAHYFQQRALNASAADREYAWSRHARYRAQVGAALPALVGSPDLTGRGRRFVDEMAATFERMAEHPAPRAHTARAQAYVKAARALWTQRHAPALPRPKE
ncbi:aKG-HExxH-type peptide beta-hydroxylase [Streptomyces soliscabiei]|uniref:aKG-HExxH-type peptide beta-hydroxylase n=1 Tax=Streptomyces soliscabiei TaxID=588897 RepID=UPI0029B99AE3|nr:HEXXH motif-containing putative peptide modification protein [Streptomyces sp. NY05-11A]MDX2682014.1 HEXXH motif-containing putative peptide modification protein [Streptomyces sp. NY05-11A]